MNVFDRKQMQIDSDENILLGRIHSTKYIWSFPEIGAVTAFQRYLQSNEFLCMCMVIETFVALLMR